MNGNGDVKGANIGILSAGGIVLLALSGAITYFVVSPVFSGIFSHRLSYTLAIFLWLMLLLFMVFGILVHFANRQIIPALWRNLRPFRTVHFILMVIIGLVISDNVDYLAANNVPFILVVVFLLVFIWQYTVMINDIHDIEIDRLSNIRRPLIAGAVTKKGYANLMFSFAAFAVIFGFILGPLILALALFCLFLGTVYSVPPFRVRDRLWSSVIIGAGSACAFLMGYFTPNYLGMSAALTMDALFIGLIIFSTLSIAPVLTDLKDYKGDRQASVKTIYTVFGLKEGKKVASALVPVLFMVPALVFNGILDMVIFVALGAAATFIFYKKGDFRGVFLCYFVVLIYCITRLTGLSSGGI